MMKKVLRVFRKDGLLILLFSISISSCNTSTNNSGCFALEEFAIDNPYLDSIIDSVANWHFKSLSDNMSKVDSENNKVMLLEFSHRDSILLFKFIVITKSDAIYKYIYRYNKRIIGYKPTAITNVILVSDINNIVDFGNLFLKFIHPTGNVMIFDFMRFPSDYFYGDSISRWPNFDSLFDPSFIVYQYNGQKFLSPIITTNLDVME
jgi:hypothetical protein